MAYITNARSQSLRAGVIGAVALSWPALAGNEVVPDAKTGWIARVPDSETPIGDDFILPPSGTGPVTFDNRLARKLASVYQPRRHLSNPILLTWVREELRKLNERALTEVQPWTPKERC